MRKRLIIIHGYRDRPDHGWMLWLKEQANKLGYDVVAPQMPVGKIPNLSKWVGVASRSINHIDKQTILLGHSLGTYTLLRYLSKYRDTAPHKEKAKALILVSGFVTPGRGSADLFFKPQPNIDKVKSRVEKVYSIISDDDKSVLPEKSLELSRSLGGQEIILHKKGHFLNKNTPTIPELIKIIKSIDSNL